MESGPALTHYAVLGVAEDAPYAHIRARYRSALLALHPDKLAPRSCGGCASGGARALSLPSGSAGCGSFLRLRDAWVVLKDPGTRAEYDRRLGMSRFDAEWRAGSIVAEDVCLEEMSAGAGCEAERDYVYPCRCGDYFSVSKEDLVAAAFGQLVCGRGNEKAESQIEQEASRGEQSAGTMTDESGLIDVGIQRVEQHHTWLENGMREDTGVGEARCLSRKAQHQEHRFLILPCTSCSLNIRLHF